MFELKCFVFIHLFIPFIVQQWFIWYLLCTVNSTGQCAPSWVSYIPCLEGACGLVRKRSVKYTKVSALVHMPCKNWPVHDFSASKIGEISQGLIFELNYGENTGPSDENVFTKLNKAIHKKVAMLLQAEVCHYPLNTLALDVPW